MKSNDFTGIAGNKKFQVNGFCDFLQNQLKVNPKERARARDLLSHPFISEFKPLKEDIVRAVGTNDERYLHELFDTFTDWGMHIDQALIAACQRGHESIVETILTRYDGENASLIDRSLALHWAARVGSLEVVKLLLHHGADVNVVNGARWTPKWTALIWAIRKNNTSVAEHLLSHPDIDVDIDAKYWLNHYESIDLVRCQEDLDSLKRVVEFMESKEKERLESGRAEQQE